VAQNSYPNGSIVRCNKLLRQYKVFCCNSLVQQNI
jgi:hypothetical protein